MIQKRDNDVLYILYKNMYVLYQEATGLQLRHEKENIEM